MRCLFCLSSDPPSGFSDEHVFPEAVGGSLLIRSVCKDCNDRLGHSVDTKLTEHALVQIKRQALRIPGKSGVVPNPFRNAVLADDPTQKVRLHFDQGGAARAFVVPSVQRQVDSQSGTLHVCIDATDEHRLEEIINTALARAGGPTLSAEAIEELKSYSVLQNPKLTMPMSLDLVEYKRALMKIVYELSCHWLGDRYVDDPTAQLIRDFIFDDDLPLDSSERHPIRGTMRLAPSAPFLPFWPDEGEHLMGCLLDNGQYLAVIVSVLGMLDCAVRVTYTPDTYPARTQRFVMIDPQTGNRRESTFEDEMNRFWTTLDRNLGD